MGRRIGYALFIVVALAYAGACLAEEKPKAEKKLVIPQPDVACWTVSLSKKGLKVTRVLRCVDLRRRFQFLVTAPGRVDNS